MTGLDNNTVLLLNFQETSGTVYTAVDASANNFAITYHGDNPNVYVGDFTHSLAGRGFQTGGTGDGSDDNYLSVATNSAFAFGTGEWTIDFWLYVQNEQGSDAYQCLVELDGTANGISLFRHGTNDELSCTINGTTVTETWNAPGTTFAHVAAVRSGNTLSLYVNGTRVGNGTSVAGKSVSNSNGVTIMNNIAESQQQDGVVSEVRISDTARWTGASFTVPNAPYSSTGMFNHCL